MKYQRGPDGLFHAYPLKKEYLRGIQGRLEDEIAPLLQFCKQVADRRQIGFWVMIRLLMPIVEAVGYVKYPELRDSAKYASQVLKDLNVPYPKLSWRVFRDCLIHSDEITHFFNDHKQLYAGWQISFGGRHEKKKLLLSVDVEQLYEDLYTYIGKMIEETNDTDRVELRGVRVSQQELDNDPELKKEYDQLFG